MIKKFILPIFVLLVIYGYIIYEFITISSVNAFIIKVAFCVLVAYIFVRKVAMYYQKKNRGYTFLSITLTVFRWIFILVAIIFVFTSLCFFEVYRLEDGCPDLLEQVLYSTLVALVTSFIIGCIPLYELHHNENIWPY